MINKPSAFAAFAPSPLSTTKADGISGPQLPSDIIPPATESIVLLWPDSVREADVPNRDLASFENSEYYELQQSIRLTNGNLEPIKVRRIERNGAEGADHSGIEYEIVYGHRRVHACKKLKIQVRAVVVEGLNDADLLRQRIAENSGREDFRPLELGRIFKHALDKGLYSNQKSLASETGRDEGDISRALALAELPVELINAFGSPADLQYRHSKPLSDAVKRDRVRVIAIAVQIAKDGGTRTPAEVMSRLTRSEKAPIGRSNSSNKRRLELGGKAYGEMLSTSSGRVTIELKQTLDAAAREELQRHLDKFMQGMADRHAKVALSPSSGSGAA